MSYRLNRSDGTILTDLVDGQVDEFSTTLTLVGRSYTGYGEFLNENLIHQLENFANTVPPQSPMNGQLWWDTSTNQMNVFNGSQWNPVGRPYVSEDRPILKSGDIWFNRETQQTFINDGENDNLLGPSYTLQQGQSGVVVHTVSDNFNNDVTLTGLYSYGNLIALMSDRDFTVADQEDFQEYSPIRKGITVVDDGVLWGTAERTLELVDGDSNSFSPSDFIQRVGDARLDGSLWIYDNDGVWVGTDKAAKIRIENGNLLVGSDNDTAVFQDIQIVVKSLVDGGDVVDAIRIDSENNRVGVFTSEPATMLDVNGSTTVRGNLEVVDSSETSLVDLNVSSLRTRASVINLSTAADVPQAVESAVESGIVVRVSDYDRTLLWNKTSGLDAWESNIDIDIPSDRSYHVGGESKLTADSLINITSAPQLTSVGILSSLDVDDITIDSSSITSISGLEIAADQGIVIATTDDVEIYGSNVVVNSKIRGVSEPMVSDDAATKQYVDRSYDTMPVALAIDVTGVEFDEQGEFIGATSEVIAEYTRLKLSQLVPPTDVMNGRIARIHVSRFLPNQQTTIDLFPTTEVTKTTVDSAGTPVDVVSEVSFDTANGTFTLAVERLFYVYVVSNGVWVWLDDSTEIA